MREKPKGFHRIDGLSPRFRVAYVYALLFVILTVMLLAKLGEWTLTSEEIGYCYRTEHISGSGASHPETDQLYVALTAIWLLAVIFGTVFGSTKWRKFLLISALIQFPLHLYFMVALRSANMPHLESDENEDDWDFGQTTAMLLLCATITELFRKAFEYYTFERDLKRYGPERANRDAEMRAEMEKEKGGRAGPIGAVVDSLIEASKTRSDEQGGQDLTQPLNQPRSYQYGEQV